MLELKSQAQALNFLEILQITKSTQIKSTGLLVFW